MSSGTVVRTVGRGSAALVLGVAAAGLAYIRTRHSLPQTTDIAGYPTFKDFDPGILFWHYYSGTALVLVAAVAYVALGRWGPLRLARPEVAVTPAGGTEVVASPARPGTAPLVLSLAWLVPLAVTVTLLVGIAHDDVQLSTASWTTGVLSALGIAGVGALVGPQVPRWREQPTTQRIAGGVSLVALLATPALGVLLHTADHHLTVRVISTGRTLSYGWIPLPVIVLLVLGLAVWAVVGVLRSVRVLDPHAAQQWHRRALIWVVLPVFLYVLLAHLPGMMGAYQGFDDAQELAASTAVFHQGVFPFKGLFVIHGIMSDILMGEVGQHFFAADRWGVAAGINVIVVPALWIGVYAFGAWYSRGRAWIIAVIVLPGMVLPLPGVSPRWILLPPLLILLGRVLDRGTWARAWAFGPLLVLATILTPELTFGAVGMLGVLVGRDVAAWRGGRPWRGAFDLTIRVAATCVVASVVWFAYLAANGAVSGFFDYYRIFGPGHVLAGALPGHLGSTEVKFDVFAPAVAIAITVLRVVVRWHRGQAMGTRLLVLLAAAITTTLYIPKELGRFDAGHIFQVFTVAMPLILGLIIDLCCWFNRQVVEATRGADRPRWLAVPQGWGPAPALFVVAILLMAATPWTSIKAQRVIPSFEHVAVAGPPTLDGLGYTDPSIDPEISAFRQLRAVVDALAPAGAPIADFTNSPGVVINLLGRKQATRFLHVSEAIPAFAQRFFIADLERSRPPVALMPTQSMTFGLPQWDGLNNNVRHPIVAAWLLRTYRPVAQAGGVTVLVRKDRTLPMPTLAANVVPPLTSLYAHAGSCDWGTLVDFLPPPTKAQQQLLTPLGGGTQSSGLEAVGWSVTTKGVPAAVIVTEGGRQVARIKASTPRPDVAALHGQPALFSGFDQTVSIADPSRAGFFSDDGDGTVTPLVVATPHAADPATITDDTGRVLTVEAATGVAGHLDSLASAGTTSAYAVPGGNPDDTSWLRVDLAQPSTGRIKISSPGIDVPSAIYATVTPRVGRSVWVNVGACPVWRAMDHAHLLVTPEVLPRQLTPDEPSQQRGAKPVVEGVSALTL